MTRRGILRDQISFADLRDEDGNPVSSQWVEMFVRGSVRDGEAQSISAMAQADNDGPRSGHQRHELGLDVELALDRFQAHSRTMFGDEGGAVLTLALLRQGNVEEPPQWLVNIFVGHEAALRAALVREKYNRDGCYPDGDPYESQEDEKSDR